ncbi:MAG: hypothetical protein J6Y42_01615 [Bacilli bacterium]|nr:hypothetical protein [Bacilli bacterium]
MKEELIRVLNNKLNDINSDINSLVEINKKIAEENENLSYVTNILDLFKDNDENNILNFSKLDKDDFDRVVDIIGENAKEVFNTDSCNYDGLVYLINGINSGISLELNEEQKNGINYLIEKLNNKVDEYSSAIDGYELVKTRYDINDVGELENKKSNYSEVVGSLEKNDYINNTDLLMEALKYNDLSEEEIINILGYVLEYNANVYREKGPVIKEEVVEETVEEPVETTGISYDNNEENIDNSVFSLEENEHHEENEEGEENTFKEDEFHFNDVSEINIPEFNPITFEEQDTNESIDINEEIPEIENTEDIYDGMKLEEYEENNTEDDYGLEVNESEQVVEEPIVNEDIPEVTNEEITKENYYDEVHEPIDDDFKDIVDNKEDYEENIEESSGEMSSTRDLQKLFDKYGIKEDSTYLNELVAGDINKYQDILETLKNKDLINKLNGELLVKVLLNSNSDDIIKVLDIIEEDLSVDKDDYAITTKITIDTLPSIFVSDGGNYRNFIENTRLFKELGLNLINLFDFSKEIFVANHDHILKNLEVVQKYGFEVTYKNAKYLLLLPNIGDRLDYYVESVYEDKLKGEIFDGVEYIKDYAAKLNVVTDETIKRIRYSSENGRKVFGSKPKSLTGEITNLKVNALDISSDYLNKFFNNDFADFTGDEVREYVKLIHNSSNVGDYSDELEMLNSYKNDLRYVIEGINISSNKVVRNYNILRSYGMDKKKSLEFAICYNLVITKEEYDKLNAKLDEIGGNL